MKNVIITGATSGIGFAVCKALLRQKFRVIGIGHSENNCKKAKESLLAEFPGSKIEFFCGDLMQLREVKRLADMLAEYLETSCEGKLDVLINNAGCVRSWYTTTEDGYEQQFALNHLSGFSLIFYMLPYLRKAEGRIIFTSSASHKMMKMRWKDLMFVHGYNPLLAYKQSKLCNMLTVYAINERFAKYGIRAYGVDPGLVKTDIGNKQTGGIVNIVWNIRKKFGDNPDIPAKTYCWLCIQNAHPDGIYYFNCAERRYSKEVNKVNADRLFKISEQLCSIHFEEDCI